ncbi:hypothetical protein [Methylobacterium marchantiae]|uniref:Uncharacterized protein n=1 Tax=Methylobacterium marchantiae TaxID=600331 RepID=A0ABW3X2F6_9HYPH|nr:hypothetical protein AIGOOFII_3192 [Methylobacterium marchantiae]
MTQTIETGAAPAAFTPFADEAAVETIGGLSLENGAASIAIHGSLDLTRDRAGLERARRLKAVAETIVAALEAADLPDEAPQTASNTRKVENPFA